MNSTVIEKNNNATLKTDDCIVQNNVLIGIGEQLEVIRVPIGVHTIAILCPEVTNDEGQDYATRQKSRGNEIAQYIKFPATVETIDDHAFQKFTQLQNIYFTTNTYYIGRNAFTECESLEYIRFPTAMEYTKINEEAFSHCIKLDEVKLPNTPIEIHGKAFKGCTSLKRIILPEKCIYKGKGIFDDCINLKTIIIRYQTIDELKKLTKNPSEFFAILGNCIENPNNIGEDKQYTKTDIEPVDIIFQGEPLKRIDQIKIKKKLRKLGYCRIKFQVIKEEMIYEEKDELKELIAKNEDKYSTDIIILIKKIIELYNPLPINIKNRIKDKVIRLLYEYENNLILLKPRIGESDSNMHLGSKKSIEELKPNLLAELDYIIVRLTSVEELTTILTKLKQYKEVLFKHSTIANNDNDSITEIIKKILYNIQYLPGDKKEEIIELIQSYIDKEIKEIAEKMQKSIDNETQLEHNKDYLEDLYSKLAKINNEIKIDYENIKPYKLLLLGLMNCEAEFNNSDQIIDLISSIKYIITKLTTNEYKIDLQKKLNQILKKYIEIIGQIICDKELLKKSNYQETENNIRKELQPLLKEIYYYANLEKYKKETENKEDLEQVLKESIEILRCWDIIEIDEEKKKKPVTSYVIEFNNKVLSSKTINNGEKAESKKILEKKLSEILTYLKNTQIETTDEYNALISLIMRAIADVDIDYDQFVKNIDEYKRHTK